MPLLRRVGSALTTLLLVVSFSAAADTTAPPITTSISSNTLPSPLGSQWVAFEQPSQPSWLDILFVVDTNDEIKPRLEALGRATRNLLAELPDGLDYNVAVIPANAVSDRGKPIVFTDDEAVWRSHRVRVSGRDPATTIPLRLRSKDNRKIRLLLARLGT
jgi:hypothetical protein